MPRAQWPLRRGRPGVKIELTLAVAGQLLSRVLLADTGAGSLKLEIELILRNTDCQRCGGTLLQPITLRRAYSGTFPTYLIRVKIPPLNFDQDLQVVGVPSVPTGFDGIACFRFLNRFGYGNFADPIQFGLEN